MLLMGAGRDTHTGEFITHFKHEEGVGCRFYQQENLVHIQTVIGLAWVPWKNLISYDLKTQILCVITGKDTVNMNFAVI